MSYPSQTQFQRMIEDGVTRAGDDQRTIESKLGFRLRDGAPKEIAYARLPDVAALLNLDLDELRSRWLAERYPGSIESLVRYLSIRARSTHVIVDPAAVKETLQ
jgi:hypothetical protein